MGVGFTVATSWQGRQGSGDHSWLQQECEATGSFLSRLGSGQDRKQSWAINIKAFPPPQPVLPLGKPCLLNVPQFFKTAEDQMFKHLNLLGAFDISTLAKAEARFYCKQNATR